ncbi:MAG: VanZ family protein [Alphaproteobacteria bacterium]|nr:VanZ family protein [Alphaproteobacteria bacterium]
MALSSGLILYGTLYPFDFAAGAHPGAMVSLLTASLNARPGRGDILSNVVLFLPFGFFAMQCLLPRAPRLARLLVVVMMGAALSLGIECAQAYLPSRVTSLYDLALNAHGALFGAVAGWIDWRGKLQAGGRPPAILPLLLLGAWLGYRLFPYVPTIDFQHVRDALKPLLSGELPLVDVLRHFAGTLVVGRLLQALTTPRRALLGMLLVPLGVIAAKLFIVTKVIMPGEVAGVVAGVAFWVIVLGRWHRRTAVVATVLAAQIAVQGVVPLIFRPEPVLFSFIPFIGFQGGSMAVNLQAFLEKVFLYGALVWLLIETGRRLVFTLIVSAAFLTAIELVQMYLAHRVSEITDPLLAIILGLALYILDLRDRAKRRPVEAGSRRPTLLPQERPGPT